MADDRDQIGGDDLGDVAIEHEPTVTYIPVSEDALSVLSPEEAGRLAGLSGHALIVQRGPQTGKTWVLPAGVTGIGRHPESDIFLDDVTVSRHHCRVTVAGDAVTLEDVGSTNGTYVNDSRVDRVDLSPGDRLLVGKFHLVVARGDG
ncbi:MAG: FHA domain-containing protein [Acidimicrobiia bacterium]|nr:FHA domain-containing protein [Acidimicrobiia bacterium]